MGHWRFALRPATYEIFREPEGQRGHGMKHDGDGFRLSASDLVGHLNCRHLTELEKTVALGLSKAPKVWDPNLAALWERGSEHEASYVSHLNANGLDVLSIDGFEISTDAVAETTAAMKAGREIIAQGALQYGVWVGRADILRRVEVPSSLGAWSYEVFDTKLARETKGSTVLQISLYSELITQVQGLAPEHMYVVPPWKDFAPQQYRVTDFAAYYRHVKRSLEAAVAAKNPAPTYPEPNAHCEICRWRFTCEQKRHDDDHLSLVAGICPSPYRGSQSVGPSAHTFA
jgi:predicted RecB family nuclease